MLDPYEDFGPTDSDFAWVSDPDKLRLLADWFDAQDEVRGVTDTDIQDDLRRIAADLERDYVRDDGLIWFILAAVAIGLLVISIMSMR